MPNGAGVGLGLAVAKGFVETMGGTITAEDTPAGGLAMSISLPAAAPAGPSLLDSSTGETPLADIAGTQPGSRP